MFPVIIFRIHFGRIVRTTAAWFGASALAFGIVIGGQTVHIVTAEPVAVQTCGSATPQLRTTLYFGGAPPERVGQRTGMAAFPTR